MSLDAPSYIVSLLSNIRSRPIPWEGAVRAKTITEADHKKIKAIDKVRKEQRKEILQGHTSDYVSLFLGDGQGGQGQQSVLQSAAKRQDMVVYLLVLLDDSIEDSPPFLNVLLQQRDFLSPFLPLLENRNDGDLDDPLALLAALLVTKLLHHAISTSSSLGSLSSSSSSKQSRHLERSVGSLYQYLALLAKSSDAGHQDIAVQSYSSLLQTRRTRIIFWDMRTDTLDPLLTILKAAAGTAREHGSSTSSQGTHITKHTSDGIAGEVGIQLLYRILLVIWQLSFESGTIGHGLQDEHDMLNLYVGLLRISPKEKISRLILSTLRNLLTASKPSLLPAASLARLPSVLQLLQAKHLSDPDLLEDLDALTTMLSDYTQTQTTFDEYAAEVRSGRLRWSPPHRSADFWPANARRILDDNKAELPRLLADILARDYPAHDKQVLAVACNDVACLVKEVPEKRAMLDKLGLKTKVMLLMQDSDEAVRWESLRAVGEWLRYSFV